VLTAAMLVALAPVATTEQPSQDERTKLVQYLTSTRDQVIAETEKLSDAQWSFKTAPERWSAGEVVEHLALAETFIFDMHQKAMAGPPATAEQQAAAKGKDDMILKVIPDRTKKAQAPEPLQPGTRLGPRAKVMDAFKERRAKTLDYAAKTTADLRGRVGDSPLGPLDGYQWLLFVGAHTERHLAQIREVKADPKFPKGTP
jgi:DinB superfamily